MTRARNSSILAPVGALLLVCLSAGYGATLDTSAIVGTWEHVATSKTPDGTPEPTDQMQISWNLEADGSGTYHQFVKAIKMNNESPLFWKLNGDTIELYRKQGARKPTATYTVIEHSEDTMLWRNNRLGDYYHVERR